MGQRVPQGRVVVQCGPPIDLALRGGMHGDVRASAVRLKCIGPRLAAKPGLHTMATVPAPRCGRG